ncbi:MAG: response regulator [Bryobacteraceae bacterium]
MTVPERIPPRSETLDRVVHVLSVSGFEEDHESLRSVFQRSNWIVSEARLVDEALTLLAAHQPAIVLCEERLPDGTWRDVLEGCSRLSRPPRLIVTSTRGDERLWAEVLNLGAYDLLLKPFEREEVSHVISIAWLHWREEQQARLVAKAAG